MDIYRPAKFLRRPARFGASPTVVHLLLAYALTRRGILVEVVTVDMRTHTRAHVVASVSAGQTAIRHAKASAAFMCQETAGPSSQHESRGLPHSRQT